MPIIEGTGFIGELEVPRPTAMRKFDYRAPRFSVDLPVRLTLDDSTTHIGLCREISSDGMKLEFHRPLAPNSSGTLRIEYRDFELDLPVRVVHTGSICDGVRFVYETDVERDEVNRLMAVLANATRGSGSYFVR